MNYEALLQKFNKDMVGIQWDLVRCHDIYRLNKLAERMKLHAEEMENITADAIKELENG
jgi:hypothetical protein